MSDSANLQNHFLVASPYLEDPRFHGALIYLCEHSSEGALGLVINRPMDLTLGDILEQMDLDGAERNDMVFHGGPVQQERGFVLHGSGHRWQHTAEVSADVSLTTSRDILVDLGEGEGPEHYLLALGYSGWGEGQLEDELGGDAWLTCPAEASILFHTRWQDRYNAALKLIGIDLNQLTGGAGHA